MLHTQRPEESIEVMSSTTTESSMAGNGSGNWSGGADYGYDYDYYYLEDPSTVFNEEALVRWRAMTSV